MWRVCDTDLENVKSEELRKERRGEGEEEIEE